MTREEIFKKIQAAGRAALTVDIENTHSGNISIKFTGEGGEELLAITATGSPKGDLTPDRICYPSLTGTNFGHFKASSETDIHALILQIPGVTATMHGHTKTATVVTMDDARGPKLNPRAPFVPADPLGVRYLGEVPVDYFKVASGSREMAEGVHERLKTHPVTIVQEHGAFARGQWLEEALFYLCLVEHSAEVIFWAERVGADLATARNKVWSMQKTLLKDLPAYFGEENQRRDFADEPDTIEMFLTTGFRIFESRLSPFHTGSMSVRGASTLLYCPQASLPHDLPGPMLEMALDEGAESGSNERPDHHELALHRLIYRETPLKAVLHLYPSEVETEAMITAFAPGRRMARILPIDVEGGFLYPAIPLLPSPLDPDDLCRALLDYHMAIVENGGIWAAGEQALGEAMRHISSAKDICRYRIQARVRGLQLSAMEPERARTW